MNFLACPGNRISCFPFLLAVLMVVSFLTPSNTQANAWLIAPGQWESYHEISYYSADQFWDDQGDTVSFPRYSKWEKAHRLEYGLSKTTTLGLDLRFAAVHSSNLSSGGQSLRGWNGGIADPRFYLRRGLWQSGDGTVLSAQGGIKLPSAFENGDLARSGTEEFSYEARLLAGHGWQGEQNHFTNLALAYEYRPQNSADLIHADATLGVGVSERWMVMPQIFSSWRAQSASSGFTQTPDDAYNLTKAQLSAVYEISDGLHVQLGGYVPVYGRNTGQGSGFLISLWNK